MPEATVHEEDRLMLGKYKIWVTGQFAYMQSITKPE
jgi:hypothetical protein